MRVLVLHPPLSLARDFVDYPQASDLGAVQLAGALRQGHQVTLLDALALPGAGLAWRPDGRARLGVEVGALLEAARAAGRYDAAVVALTPFHRPPARDDLLGPLLAGLRAQAPAAPLLLADCYQSGQHYLEVPAERVLAAYPEADAWVKYEAERTVPALLAGLGAGARPARAALAGEEADLASLPEPAWDLVDLAARDALHRALLDGLGRPRWPFPIDGRTLPLVTSRGCPYDCLHCSSNPGRPAGAPKRQRRLPAARLAAWCAAPVRHGATRLWLLDELANASRPHFEAVLGAVEALGVGLEIPNGLRADGVTARDVARLRGRITTLSVSAESGVQRVVDEVVGKRLDLGEVERVAGDCRQAGLPLLVHYLIGLPGERPEEVNGTLRHAVDLQERHGAIPAVQFATPLPGTRLAALAPPLDVPDFGPSFQVRPSRTNPAVPPEQLARFRWALQRRLAVQGPRKLILNLTYRCNNHCAFCAVGNRGGADGQASHQRALLDRFRREGVRQVDFDGGEPTLHRELIPLVQHAVAAGYQRIAVTTNGRVCSYRGYARRLARSGVTTLLVSLHGPDRATHGRLVGLPEAFDQTVAGLRNLVAEAPPGLELGVNVTVVRGNVDALGQVAALAWDLGVRRLALQLLTPFGRATRDQAPDPEVAAARIREVVEAWHPRLGIAVVNLPLCFLPGLEALVAPDLDKAERHMVFTNDEEVNLAGYLAGRRVRRPACDACPYAICCGGFYEFDDAPEPPWSGAPAPAARAAAISPSPKTAR